MREWATARLGEISAFERSTIAPDSIETGSLYVGLENIETGGRFKGVGPVESGDLTSSKFRFTPQHILYGKLRPNLAKIALPDFAGICSTDVIPIAPNSRVDRRYLAHYLRHPDVVELAAERANGANLPRISPRVLAQFEVPLPPVAEQKRIAAILDKANTLCEKRQQAIEVTNELAAAVFTEIFLADSSRAWPKASITDLLDVRTGKLDSNAAVEGGPYPFFTCGQQTLSIDRYAFDCEALLLAGNNATADYSVKQYRGKFNAYQRTYVMTLRDPSGSYEYTRYALEHRLRELKHGSKGTGTKYLTMELLNRTLVPFPPVALQWKFSSRVLGIENLKALQLRGADDMAAGLRQLQTRAFRGEL